MTDSNVTFGDLSDEEDTHDMDLDDFDDLPSKDPIVKNLSSEFTVEPTPSKILSRQSVSHSREHMKVYLRIRPFTEEEVESGESQETMSLQSESCLVMRAPKDSFTFKSSQRGFGDMTHKFTFTRIFGQETSQKGLFDDTMLATVKDFVDGQNCLVFTYGVTNAGKTYTIQGTPQDGGILPRALDVVFNSIEGRHFNSIRLKPRYFCDVVRLGDRQVLKEEEIKRRVLAMSESDTPKDTEGDSMAESDTSKASHYSTATEESVLSESTQDSSKDGEGISNMLEDIRARIPDDTSVDVEAQGPIKFSIWVSFAEIYNEHIYDLLDPIPKGKKARRQVLKLGSDKNGSIFIKGLKEIQVDSADEAYKVLKIGQNNRSIASTKLNQCSSRSHCIFSIKILRVVDVEEPHVARVSKLSFCDLAGSERYTRTHNTGERLKEAGNINTSLLTLGKCIHTLRYNQNHPKAHPKIIPFRESKLTRLFQSFFLGKGKAHMIVNVNQCASGFDETLHVLKFSAIAKQVTTVTSKLDNKWKQLPRKLASARAVSMVINQANDANASRDTRPSIAWATPGTAKAVAEELGELDMIEESILETEEEEEGDVDSTPMGDKSVFQQDGTVSRLKRAVEVLKKQLIEEKQKMLNMEIELRDEICREMAQQIVQIEEDYNERLREEQEYAEEKYERKLELYAKSVKKANKRRKKDDDGGDDDEYVSSAILAAEQVKVQERNAKIEDLEGVIEKLKEESVKDEEKMNAQNQTLMDLQSLVEENKVTLEEANKRLCSKGALLEQVQADLETSKDECAAQNRRVDELTERINSTEAQFQEQQKVCEALKQDIIKNEQLVKQTKTEYDVLMKEKDDKILELMNAQSLEADDTNTVLNKELAQKVKKAEDALAQHVALFKEKDLQLEELTSAVEQGKSRESEFSAIKEELEKKVVEVENAKAEQERNKELVQKVQEAEDALAEHTTLLKEKELQLEELKCVVEQGKCRESEFSTIKEELEKKLVEVENAKAEQVSLCEQKEAELIKLSSNLSYVQQSLKAAKELQQKGDETVTFEAHEQRIKIEHLEENLERAEKMAADLKGKLDAAQKEHSAKCVELQSQVAHTQEQLTRSVADVECLQNKFRSLQEEGELQIKNLKSQLASAHEATAEVESSKRQEAEARENLKQETEQLRTEVANLREELESISEKDKKQIECLSRGIEKAKADSKAAEQEFEVKINELNKHVENMKAELEKSQGVISDDKTEVDALKAQIGHLKEELRENKENSAVARKEVERLQFKAQESETAVKDGESFLELLKNQIKDLESDLEKEKSANEKLTSNVKELEENLADLQQKFDEANETGREASSRIRHLEENLSKVQDGLTAEQKAHESTKSVSSGYEARISEMRISLEMSERTAASMAKQVKRTKEVEEELMQTKAALAEKTEAIEKLASVSGDAREIKTKLQNLEKNLRASEQQRQAAQQTLQETLSRCSSLEQSLESKKDAVRDQQSKIESMGKDLEAKRSEVTKLQESKTQQSEDIQNLEENCHRLEQELASKTGTINMLMKKMEQKCQEVKTAQQHVKSTEKDLDTLKSALQEQEEAMAEQDKFLSSKEEDYKTVVEELETLQDKYASLMKTSSEDQKTLRTAQRDLAKFTNDKTAQEKNQEVKEAELEDAKKKQEELAKEVKKLQESLEETNTEVKDLEKELGETKTSLTTKEEELEAGQREFERSQLELEKMQEHCEKSQKELKERRKEVTQMREEMEKNDVEEMMRDQELKAKKITELENKLEEQEKTKEEELSKWRKDRDDLVAALEKQLHSLQEKERKALDANRDKDEYIEQLKKEMQEQMSQSAAFTDDDSEEDQGKKTTRRSMRTNSTQSKRTSRSNLSEIKEDSSDTSEPVRTRTRRGRQTMQSVKEVIVIEESPVVKNEPEPEQVDEPIYEEPPSYFENKSSTASDNSSSDSARQPSMVILEPDETDTSRVEIDVTPLQKNTRKTRNARRGRKRKSIEMLEDEGDTTSNNKKKTSTRSTRGGRRTRAACKEESEENENNPAAYAADGPLPPPGRSSRRALSKIGDMFHNSPFGKSAKKLVDNMHSPKQSPPRTVEVPVHGTDTKRRRKLYKNDISTPYECSPYESLSQQVEGTKQEEPPRAVEPAKKADNSHNIVTRKLRSRQKKN